MGEIPREELERLALAESGSCEGDEHSCNLCGGCYCRQFASYCECPRDPDTGLRYTRTTREAQNLNELDIIPDPEDPSQTLEVVDVVVETRREWGVTVEVHDLHGDSHILTFSDTEVVVCLEVPRERV